MCPYLFTCVQVHVCECMCVEARGQPWLLAFRHRALSFRDGVSHRPGNHKVGYGGWSAIPRIPLSPPLSTVIPSVHHHACLFLCGFCGSNVGSLRKTLHQLNLLLSFPPSFSKKPSPNNDAKTYSVSMALPWARYHGPGTSLQAPTHSSHKNR